MIIIIEVADNKTVNDQQNLRLSTKQDTSTYVLNTPFEMKLSFDETVRIEDLK